jgi:hypothetical protein
VYSINTIQPRFFIFDPAAVPSIAHAGGNVSLPMEDRWQLFWQSMVWERAGNTWLFSCAIPSTFSLTYSFVYTYKLLWAEGKYICSSDVTEALHRCTP